MPRLEMIKFLGIPVGPIRHDSEWMLFFKAIRNHPRTLYLCFAQSIVDDDGSGVFFDYRTDDFEQFAGTDFDRDNAEFLDLDLVQQSFCL